MKYQGVLLAVRNMETSRKFYQDVLGLRVREDFGANVALEGGIFLQTMDDTWQALIRTDAVTMGNAGELYFEEEDLSAFCERLADAGVRLVHPLIEHRWGQRVVRFYDPDGHIIEVGEKMDAVVRRFIHQGFSPEETSERMDVPLGFVRNCLKNQETDAV